MKHIHFIVNPISGKGKHAISTVFLSQYFDIEKYTVTIKFSEYKKHAIQLTQESINENATIIVACGGDGTISEVASCLVNTTVILGIIPLGSGNGLASNLKISKNIKEAIQKIINQNVEKIDVGKFNDNYFFSNCGIGFDAKVVRHYENSKNRRLLSYIKASLKSLKEIDYKTTINITIDDKNLTLKPFMVFISNSNELGYHVSLTPKASLQDGLLDVLLISKLSKLKMLLFGLLILVKKHHKLKEVKSFKTKSLHLQLEEGHSFHSQIDGEPHTIANNIIQISILENALKVIV